MYRFRPSVKTAIYRKSLSSSGFVLDFFAIEHWDCLVFNLIQLFGAAKKYSEQEAVIRDVGFERRIIYLGLTEIYRNGDER